ncbi:MAG TPA: DUF1232 domain-containing protein, partial [Lapillicoccus sp.]
MARHTNRMGLVTMIAQSVRTAVRPGSAGLGERVAAVPRMLSAIARGEYRGTTFGHVAMLAAAVVYIMSPLDFMPEALFSVFGLGDDAIVVTWLVAALVNDTEAFLAWERSGGRAQRETAGPAYQQTYPGSAYQTGHPGARYQDGRSAGPQDMPADEWYRTVQ